MPAEENPRLTRADEPVLRRPTFRVLGWRGKPREGAPSDCGHPQAIPTAEEIRGCPEIIVRECAECAAPLWWNVDRWRTV